MKYLNPLTQTAILRFFNLLFFVLSALAISTFGQSSISGRVVDKKQYLPYATVHLINNDSVLVKGTVSDDLGHFIFHDLSPDRYRITVSMIGYGNGVSEWITLGDNHFLHQEIMMEESSFQLGEVVVKVDKEQFDQQTDRLVLNLQNSIVASGNSVLEVLQRSPGNH